MPVTRADLAWFDRPSPASRWDTRIRCEDCEHIQRHTINPGAASCRCYRIPGASHYPMEKHHCSSFEAIR
jgi:hypothetical protein